MMVLLVLAFGVKTPAQLFGEMKTDLVKIEAFSSFDKVQPGMELKIVVEGKIDEGWHINSHTPKDEFLIPTVLELGKNESFTLTNVVYPKHKEVNFSFSDKPVAVYEREFKIGGLVKIADDAPLGEDSIVVILNYQACNDASCMAPNDVKTVIKFKVVDNKTAINEINQEKFSGIDIAYTPHVEETTDDESSLADTLESSGLLLSLFFVFLGGLALNLTPCVYPLIPITIGYFGGQSEGSTKRLFMLGVVYVLGIALTYSVVGVVTSLSGAIFGALLQNPIVILVVALVLFALSLSMFGLYEFKFPDSWVMKAGGAKSGMFGSFFMGLTMGIVAAPCIGPFVLGLVTYVAAKGDPVYGFLMFFFLAVGLGFPYLFLALFSGKIKNLPRSGMWMESVKHIFGFLLIGMAIYFILPLLPKDFQSWLLPAYGVLMALYLLIFERAADSVKGFFVFKIVFSLVILAVSVYALIPSEDHSPEWIKYSDAKYEEALANGDKIFIDFYADWCIPCKELDHITFADEKVISVMSDFKNFKVDLTKSMSEESEKIREKFNIRGMPTLLIYDTNGKEVRRLTGFISPDEFLKIISGIK
ncbi:MAG: thioredoxin fold domain-containing protein [Chlorobi bacterium]|nr:thioredoxin fold domain-containing protein [Chlorobiota bacterium]